MIKSSDIIELKGEILESIDQTENSITFNSKTGRKYKMHHRQECCEFVEIEDLNGDLCDLINSPIIVAEEYSDSDFINNWYDSLDQNDKDWMQSYTWTFYKLATIKGYVVIRWFGESNGYYSEGVDVDLLTN